jgi:PIN domain nuclease of toxin-antitoxin system
MRAIVDTHAFLWLLADDPRLSAQARVALEADANTIFVSAASAYEIAIKSRLGRLELPEPAESYVIDRLALGAFQPLAITIAHAARAGALPPIHGDPWDRLLVAQAQVEGIPIVTADRAISEYDVETIW